MKFHIELQRLGLLLLAAVISLAAISQPRARQRNTIYVLDCTKSMDGYNGAPAIWQPTKNFLRLELEKEARENPGSRVVILPFQEKVLHPVVVDLKDIAWPRLNGVLDNHVNRVTATNICDSWVEAEKYIDQSCENYIVLMTDGHDNIGGAANEARRTARLGQILRNFCGKYMNTKAFYVELTHAATLPAGIQDAIDLCKDLYKIDASDGIPTFGCPSGDVIHVNTRDLPAEIPVGFSNSGTFAATLDQETNPYVEFAIKGNKISGGKLTLQIKSKLGEDVEALNKALNASSAEFGMSIRSEEVNVYNPEVTVVLHNAPLRTLDLTAKASEVGRVSPFMWIKGNPADTLRWDLRPEFNDAARADRSSILFKLHSGRDLSNCALAYNGAALGRDSIILINPNAPAVIEMAVPAGEEDGEYNLSLKEISGTDLDRLNGEPHGNSVLTLTGSTQTRRSVAEILFWCVIGLTVLFLVVWFAAVRPSKYPKFKRGIITVREPYFATIRLKGYRKLVLTGRPRSQGFMDKLFKGKILYHVNPAWVCDAEVEPTGKNMRLRCPSGTLVCTPQPLLMPNMDYEIVGASDPSFKIAININ